MFWILDSPSVQREQIYSGFNVNKKRRSWSLINKDRDQMLCCSVLWSSDIFQEEEQEWPEQWLVCGLEQCPVPPSSQFLNPVVEFFSSWRWKAFNHEKRTLLWLKHISSAFPPFPSGKHCVMRMKLSGQTQMRCLMNMQIDRNKLNIWKQKKLYDKHTF